MNINRLVKRTEFVKGFTHSAFGRLLSVLMLLFVVQFFGAQTLAAQSKKVTLHVVNAPLATVLNDLSKQTHYKFFYSDNVTDPNQQVTLNVVNEPLNDVLNQIFKGTEIGFQLKNNQILLFKKSTETQQSINQNENQSFRKITGKVIDEKGQALPGVTIVVKGTTIGTITDTNGNYSFSKVSPSETLVFSFVGMESQEIKVSNQQQINVSMNEEAIGLNEVVAVGYLTEKKADLTGAVSVVKMDDIESSPTSSPMKALQGMIPGVFITTDGDPNGEATVRIRGIGTLGNNDPLYVVDGIPTTDDMSTLNPDDIESIQVLKDASSATIYGSRAANGVIIITTKEGKDKNRIDVKVSTSTQLYTTQLSPLNTEQRGEAYWRASVNDKLDPNLNQTYQYAWNGDYSNPVLNNVILPEYIDALQTMKPANTNWYKAISQPSIIQDYNVAFSNGGERGHTYLSLDLYNNKGIIKETFNKKFAVRLNSDFNFFNNKLKVGENLSSSYINNSLINAGNALNLAIQEQPIVPIYTVNGGWGGPSSGMTDRENPLEVIELNKQNVDNTVRVFGNVYADLEIIPHLHFKTSFGIDYSGEYDRVLQKSYVSGFMSDPNNMLTSNFDFQGSYTWQNTLNYDLKVNKNTFNMLLGEEQNLYNSQTFWGSREGYLLENLDYAYLNSGTSNINNGGSGTSNALLSYFAKINYSYDNKYLASVTLRRDGSSRFGLNNQFGYFPAFSLGWRLSDEKFLSNIKELSDLKLRFGWGSSGNQDIANNGTYTLYQAVYGTDPTWSADQGTAYAISGQGSGQLPSGFVLVQQGNKDLKWETTKESNFGMDFGFLHNNLTGSIDYFIRETSNILIEPGYLAAIGEGGGEWLNGASMQNKGFEAILSYSKKLSKDLSLTVSGNISSYRNMVTKLPEDVLTAYPGNGTTITILGHSINSIYGYVADGLFQSQAEVDNSPIQPGKGVGRIRYKDLNGDGSVDANDQTFISSGDPDFTYGLNIALVYKQFDFNMFLQGVQGLKEINNYKIYTDFSSIWPGTNWGSRTLDAWSPQNTSSTIPALTLTDNNNEGRTSTYLLENGSYLKVRNMQLGYNFRNVSKLISNARIYLQGSNLLTFKAKSYTAPDPENPSYAYPIPLILTIGVNITL